MFLVGSHSLTLIARTQTQAVKLTSFICLVPGFLASCSIPAENPTQHRARRVKAAHAVYATTWWSGTRAQKKTAIRRGIRIQPRNRTKKKLPEVVLPTCHV